MNKERKQKEQERLKKVKSRIDELKKIFYDVFNECQIKLNKLNDLLETSPYFIYDIDNQEIINKYLDNWYVDETDFSIRFRAFKEVDENTSYHLYNRIYNPLDIRCFYHGYHDEICVKVHLWSIDDSSYGMWLNDTDITKEKIKEIIEFIFTSSQLSGDELFEIGKTLGFHDFDTN